MWWNARRAQTEVGIQGRRTNRVKMQQKVGALSKRDACQEVMLVDPYFFFFWGAVRLPYLLLMLRLAWLKHRGRPKVGATSWLGGC